MKKSGCVVKRVKSLRERVGADAVPPVSGDSKRERSWDWVVELCADIIAVGTILTLFAYVLLNEYGVFEQSPVAVIMALFFLSIASATLSITLRHRF